jgi:hypothetical protein
VRVGQQLLTTKSIFLHIDSAFPLLIIYLFIQSRMNEVVYQGKTLFLWNPEATGVEVTETQCVDFHSERIETIQRKAMPPYSFYGRKLGISFTM